MFCSLMVLNLIWFKGIVAHAKRNMNPPPQGSDEEKKRLAEMDESTVTINSGNYNSKENYNSFT